MRTYKIVILIFIFIIFAFLHVFLQTEIIKLGYTVKKNEDKLSQLIDNNNILKYNIYVLESPYSLGKYVIMKNSHLKIMKPAQVLSLYPKQPKAGFSSTDRNAGIQPKNHVLLALKNLFNGRQAEAETIK